MSEGSNIPDDLLYTKDHEWVRVEGDTAAIGITDHAQEAMGDVTFVELPDTGMEVEAGDEVAVVESAKAASEVYAPLAGIVSEANEALEEAPEKLNEDPYGDGWIYKLESVDRDSADLLTPEEYRALLEEESQ